MKKKKKLNRKTKKRLKRFIDRTLGDNDGKLDIEDGICIVLKGVKFLLVKQV